MTWTIENPASDAVQSASRDATWPVSLMVLIVVAQPAVSLLASGLFDSIQTVVDSSWREVTTVEGNAARNVQIVGQLATAIIACHVLVTGLRRPPTSVSILAVAATVAVGFEILRGPAAAELLGQTTFLLVIWALSMSDARHQALRWLGWFALMFWITTWAFVLIDPGAASKVCREDKCSAVGFLLMGYMQHEQSLALFTALLLPTLAFLPRSVRTPALALGLLTIVATGSRTGLLAGAAGLLVFWTLAPLRGQGETCWNVRRLAPVRPLLAMMPVVATLASLGIFLLLPSQALTGRGQIWEVVRAAFAESPWFGPGRGALEHGYATGELDWVAWHEHSVGGYLLTVGGVLVLLLFLLGMFQLGLQALSPHGFVAALFLLPAATSAGTEIVWTFDLLSSVSSWTLVVAVLLAPKSRAREVASVLSAWQVTISRIRRDWKLLAGGATLGAALAMAFNAATPQVFEARRDLFLTASPESTGEVATRLEYVQLRAPSYARVVTTPWREGALSQTFGPGVVAAVEVEVPRDTAVIRLKVRASSAELASSLASVLTQQAVSRLPALDQNVHVMPLGAESAVRPVSRGMLGSIGGGAATGFLVILPFSLRVAVTPGRREPRVESGTRRPA